MSDSAREVEDLASGFSELVRAHSGGLAAFIILFNVDGAFGPMQWVLRVDAWILLGLAMSYAVHCGIHLRLGYVDLSTPATRRLTMVTILDVGLASGLVVFSVRAVNEPTLGRVVLVAAPMTVLVAILSGLTVLILTGNKELVETKRRGTDWVSETWIGQALTSLLGTLKGVAVLAACGRLLEKLTPDSLVSKYVAGLLTMVFAMTTGMATGYVVHEQFGGATAKRAFIARIFDPQGQLTLSPQTSLSRALAASTTRSSSAGACADYPAAGSVAPGQPVAPNQIRGALRHIFPGHRSTAVDQPGAGCPWVAHREKLQPSRWWETGWCGVRLRSLAVAGPAATAVMFGQVAILARYLAMRGLLDGATPVIDVGSGDFQLISTGYGNVAVMRPTRLGAPVASSRAGGPCAQPDGHFVPYVQLPPAMTMLWARLVEQRRSWVWPAEDQSAPGRAYDFLANGPGGTIVAHGACDRNGNCWLTDRAGRRSQRFTFGLKIGLRAILRFAPKGRRNDRRDVPG
jgi:hypothetical protein